MSSSWSLVWYKSNLSYSSWNIGSKNLRIVTDSSIIISEFHLAEVKQQNKFTLFAVYVFMQGFFSSSWSLVWYKFNLSYSSWNIGSKNLGIVTKSSIIISEFHLAEVKQQNKFTLFSVYVFMKDFFSSSWSPVWYKFKLSYSSWNIGSENFYIRDCNRQQHYY